MVSFTSGQQNFQEFQIPFTEALSLVFASRQTVRNPHKWPVGLPGASCSFTSCTRVNGSQEERKLGVCAASPAFPSPFAPYPQDRCQGLCSKPTCPVRTVVMATGETREVIGPFPATPLRHRFPVTEATERLCPPILCRKGTCSLSG